MTTRERTALELLIVGCCALVAAAYGYGGWRAACVVAGGLTIALGLLLGIGEPGPAASSEALEDDDEEEHQAEEGRASTMGGPWSGGGVTPAHPYGQEAS